MSESSRPDSNSTQTGLKSLEPELWTLIGVAACFALSGFAALLYQTAWMRQFSLVFGTSELAVATVLAAYMAGLALGAHTIARYVGRISRPIFAYGLLEFGIGAAAIAVPLLLVAADQLMLVTIGGQPEPPDSRGWLQTSFYVLTAFVVLVIPTAFMGATLPLLTRHVVRTPAHIGGRTGLLYAINTFGAVVGALVAAYVLLPALGLNGTVMFGAGVNVIVFGLAVLIARASARPRTPPAWGGASSEPLPPPRHALQMRAALGRHWILPTMLLSGAVSFTYEVLWSRMLSYILGGSIFAFGTMVASFLLGIAAGSSVASPIARTERVSLAGFIVCQLATALASIAIYLSIDTLVPDHAGLVGNAAVAIAVLLPATLFIGATFPFAVRILTNDPRDAPVAAARVYAWNTIGAIAGALLAGFILIPALKFEGSIYVAVLTNLALALLTCVAVARAPLSWSAAVLCAAVAVGVFFRPQPPQRLLHTSPLNVDATGELRYYDVGRSASVVVLEQNGALMLRTNGLPEAMIEMPGTVPKFSGEFWLSPLAVIARPEIQPMLIVGYGGGVVVDGIPPSVRTVDVIELEPKVIEANRAVRDVRKRDPLSDPRVRIVLNDARSALSLTTKRYDAVVSQPSHPWTAGASHLYTREFMQEARAHLNPNGVFVQWMNISFLDETLLRSLTATLLDVFSQLRIYRPDPSTLLFLASDSSLDIEPRLARTRVPLVNSPGHYALFGIQAPEDVVAALSVDQQGAEALSRGAEIITDDRNRLATDTVYDLGRGLVPAKLSRILDAYDPFQRKGSWIYSDKGLNLSFGYIARRMAQFANLDTTLPSRMTHIGQLIPDASTGAYVQAIALAARGDNPGAVRLLREALALDAGNQGARFDLIRPWLGQLAHDRGPAEIVAEVSKLPAPGQAVIEAGRYAVKEQWSELSRLDPVLAQARWTDPWFLECVQMRADWRMRVNNPQWRMRYARDALSLIDEVILTEPSVAMLALRAHTALAADRPDVVLESINGFADGALKNLKRYTPPELPPLRGNLEALAALLDRLKGDRRVSEHRVEEVRAKLLDARDQLLNRATSDSAAQ